jgi:hypothetical protein
MAEKCHSRCKQAVRLIPTEQEKIQRFNLIPLVDGYYEKFFF